MIVVGGYDWEAGFPKVWQDPDPWEQGIAVFDLPSLSWKDTYDPNAGEYDAPQVIKDWYKQKFVCPRVWTFVCFALTLHTATLRRLIGHQKKSEGYFSAKVRGDCTSKNWRGTAPDPENAAGPSPTPTPSNTSGSRNHPGTKTNVGAIVGGVVGGMLLIGLAVGLTFWYIWKRKTPVQRSQYTAASTSYDGTPIWHQKPELDTGHTVSRYEAYDSHAYGPPQPHELEVGYHVAEMGVQSPMNPGHPTIK
jgi:hypothetical protein